MFIALVTGGYTALENNLKHFQSISFYSSEMCYYDANMLLP